MSSPYQQGLGRAFIVMEIGSREMRNVDPGRALRLPATALVFPLRCLSTIRSSLFSFANPNLFFFFHYTTPNRHPSKWISSSPDIIYNNIYENVNWTSMIFRASIFIASLLVVFSPVYHNWSVWQPKEIHRLTTYQNKDDSFNRFKDFLSKMMRYFFPFGNAIIMNV